MNQMIIDGATGEKLQLRDLRGRNYWYTRSNSGTTYYTGKGAGNQALGKSQIPEIRHHEDLLGDELMIITINFTDSSEEAAFLEAAVMLKTAEEAADGLVPYIDYWRLNTHLAAENLMEVDPECALRLGVEENAVLYNDSGSMHSEVVLH
jgi:hypothetical protein